MKKILFFLLLSINCFSATKIWNGSSWSGGSVPNIGDNVEIRSDYTSNATDGNWTCKSLTIYGTSVFTVTNGYFIYVNSQDLLNLENGKVVIKSGGSIKIWNGIIQNTIAANFVVESGGNLIQGTSSNSQNIGNITVQRNTNPIKQFEYTYWSSPVTSHTMCSLSPFSNINAFSYTYPTPLPMNGWIAENCSSTMIRGKGYAVRGAFCNPYPSCFGSLPQITHSMSFVGTPNNGDISYTSNSTNNLHLIGNPYPSNLYANDLMSTNNYISAVYFWTHNTLLSSSIAGNWQYNFTNDDYAIYNLTGGVGASSPIVDGTPNNSNVPNGLIGSCQGVFIRANTNGAKTVNFKNSMRYVASNVQFFKDSAQEGRVGLFLTNNSTITRYNLVGYVSGADNDYNHQYDAELMGGNLNTLYSVLEDKDLAIQGRMPFDNQDRIPLGYKLAEGGSFQIGLNNFDGFFENSEQLILLEDRFLGITHNLRLSPYSFTAVTGITEDRFVLKFEGNNLETEEFQQNSLSIYNQGNDVVIKSNTLIRTITVYDVTGRKIFDLKDADTTEIAITSLPKGVLIFKVNNKVKKHIK